MIFDLTQPYDKQKAITYFKSLLENPCTIELLKKRKGRTISQNSYLHLVLSQYALAYGDTVDYIKQIVWKQNMCADIFKTEIINRVTGEVREGYKSSKDLDTKELTVCIDRLRNDASKNLGIYISTPGDLVWQKEIKNSIEENKQYL